MIKVKVHSKALDSTVEISRVIGHVKGSKNGPTLIFMGGIHGNEPAGVFALKRVFEQIGSGKVRGSVYGIAGNLWALKYGERYHKEDLNRLWTVNNMANLPEKGQPTIHQDQTEQVEINALIQQIIDQEEGPFYFFDMHTTSSETLPFLTVNDSLLNRNFTIQYPLPIILGIEEYLNGPILSYINELGYVAFGFEAGQHDDMASIENCISFIYLSMVYSGCINKDHCEYQHHHDILAKTTGDVRHIYEIYFRYAIQEGEDFHMIPGFYNFQRLKRHQHVAESNGNPIRAENDGRIFMPLYQPKGEDGFFTIKKIWSPFLKISEVIRKYRLDRLLVYLPGVKWIDHNKSGLLVNKQIARFMAKDFFHLFGYRYAYVDQNHFKMFNREAFARHEEYQNEPWFS
ncbi:succinylglutamate desuccinylase/aspartoacylase family protein [Ekhidna sp.]|uniref:succinylglutamate desuccinylase/aspartoacylase domain-containing protein n=1 Tax=Ekhidna sp. TaxID=2608089 RepID=UPI0032993E70